MQTEAARIEELTADDRTEIIDVLVDAFHDYPVFAYVLKDTDGEEYERRLRLLIGFFVDARLMRDWPVFGIREDGDLAAVILVSEPEFKQVPKALNAVYDEMRSKVGDDALARLEDFDSALAEC